MDRGDAREVGPYAVEHGSPWSLLTLAGAAQDRRSVGCPLARLLLA